MFFHHMEHILTSCTLADYLPNVILFEKYLYPLLATVFE